VVVDSPGAARPSLYHAQRGEDDQEAQGGHHHVRQRVLEHPRVVLVLDEGPLLEDGDADAQEEEVRRARVEQPLDEPEL
jgi:hypothetical protein